MLGARAGGLVVSGIWESRKGFAGVDRPRIGAAAPLES